MQATMLVTGATSGIGRAAALALARQGHHVVVHGRRAAECALAAQEIALASGNPSIDFVVADLADMAQVRGMAGEVAGRFPGLRVLVNNAGTFSKRRVLTPAGLELTWAVNYLSRFVLTTALLDVLRVNAPSRVVDVSGAYHAQGKLHVADLSLAQGYSLAAANNQAKLANVLFTYALARRLAGTGVTANTLHPGAVNTGSVLRAEGFSGLERWMYRAVSRFFKTPAQGAETLVYLASSAAVAGISGQYFVGKRAVRSSPQSYDVQLQDQLWDLSLGMTPP